MFWCRLNITDVSLTPDATFQKTSILQLSSYPEKEKVKHLQGQVSSRRKGHLVLHQQTLTSEFLDQGLQRIPRYQPPTDLENHPQLAMAAVVPAQGFPRRETTFVGQLFPGVLNPG